MRYIGNKTKLLSFIGDFLDRAGIGGGRALDAFAGTAAVGSFLKARGFDVAGCDVMTYSYVFQRAYVAADRVPSFAALRGDPAFERARSGAEMTAQVDCRFGPTAAAATSAMSDDDNGRALAEVLLYLDRILRPRASFITRHFSASPDIRDGERSYFSRTNAMRIDAIRHQIEAWSARGMLDDDARCILLAALLEGADAVANTTGIYAAFVKSWQPNARRPLTLRVPPLVPGTRGRSEAHQGDVNALVASLGHFDLLYLDPPYNTRQYSAYYHVPELIARGWFDAEPELRGKTGLIPDADRKSAWSTRDGCVRALEDLVARADATHLLMSYNSEGLIPESDIERIFRARGVADTYACERREYARYRSDSDSAVRRYKADVVTEKLYYVRVG